MAIIRPLRYMHMHAQESQYTDGIVMLVNIHDYNYMYMYVVLNTTTTIYMYRQNSIMLGE